MIHDIYVYINIYMCICIYVYIYIYMYVYIAYFRSIYCITLAWSNMLILWNKGFHELVLTILIWSLFNTLVDLSYSAFVSKLFISNDSPILRSCMLDSFASILLINPPMITFGMFSCTRRLPFFCHVIFLVLSRSSKLTFFFGSPFFICLPP